VRPALRLHAPARDAARAQDDCQVSLNTVESVDTFLADINGGRWDAVLPQVAHLRLPVAKLEDLYEQARLRAALGLDACRTSAPHTPLSACCHARLQPTAAALGWRTAQASKWATTRARWQVVLEMVELREAETARAMLRTTAVFRRMQASDSERFMALERLCNRCAAGAQPLPFRCAACPPLREGLGSGAQRRASVPRASALNTPPAGITST